MKNSMLKKIVSVIVILMLMLGIAVAVSSCNGADNPTEKPGTETEAPSETDEGGKPVESGKPSESEKPSESGKPSETEPGDSTETGPSEEVCEHEFNEGVVETAPTCTEKGTMLYTCTLCGETKTDNIPVIDHTYNDGVVTKEPTLNEEGEKEYTCTACGHVKKEAIDKLPATYVITIEGMGELRLDESGEYELADPEKPGYKFLRWVTADGKEFASSGTIKEDVTISAVFELLMTTTVEQLEERAAQGADVIVITKDIIIDRPIYVTAQTKIYSDNNVKLLRSVNYAGDIFVVGEDKNGIPSVVVHKKAELTLGGGKGTITIDGNRDALKVTVVGSAVYVSHSATVNIHDGVVITNNKKLGNERSFTTIDFAGELWTTRPGGAAILIMNGTVNMYGGLIEKNLVVTESTVVDNEDGTQSWFETAGCGGAVYNCGNFNMYGGTIRENEALRGGAIYNDEIVLLVSGTISDNLSHSYGGAVSSSSSQEAQIFIGSDTEDGELMKFIGNRSMRAGGGLYSSTNSPIVILGNTLFVENHSDTSGGAIYTAGGLTVRDTAFEGNYCMYSGGSIYFHYSNPDYNARIMELTDCTFTGNKANLGGAVILSAAEAVKDKDTAAKAVITNCEFNDNEAVLIENEDGTLGRGNGGAVYVTRKAVVTFNDCSFTDNVADNNAGAVAIHSNSNVTINNTDFKNNKSTFGGAIYTSSGSTISINGAEFDGNKAERITPEGPVGNGGAIYANGVTVSNFKNVTISNNSAVVNGGAIYMCAMKLNLDATVSMGGNSAGNHGGAIYVTYTTNEDTTKTPGELTVNGSEFKGNTALSGGAISARTESIVKISNAKFTENTTPDAAMGTGNGGGAIYSNNSTLTITDVTMDKNTSGYYGGAMKLDSCELTAKNLTINGSQGGTGGAIYASGGSINAENLIISDNVSSLNGVIYLTKNNVKIKNIKANGNSAVSGGVLYSGIDALVEITDPEFSGNTANSGGALYISGADVKILGTGKFIENTATSQGGAIYVIKNERKLPGATEGEVIIEPVASKLAISGAEFKKNEAARGGAIYVNGNEYTVSNSSFIENKATDETYGGGAIYNTGAISTLSGVTFKGNTSHKGGAVALHTRSEMTISKVTAIANSSTANTAGEEGNGGVFYVNNSKLELVKGGAEGDAIVIGGAGDNGNTAVHGGAIYVTSGEITINDASLINNSASANGGAIHSAGSIINIEGANTSISNNTAGGHGGALYLSYVTREEVKNGTQLVMNGGRLDGNSALAGGAISARTAADVKLNGTVLSNNSASGISTNEGGGAIYGNNNVLVLSGVTLDANSSAYYGGALACEYANVTIKDNSVIKNNKGTTGVALEFRGGEYTLTDVSLTDNNKNAEGNDANGSGVIYVTSGGKLNVKNLTASGNKAVNGGVIYSSGKSEISIENSKLTGNTASNNGGAIDHRSSVLMTVKGTEISGNSAKAGGAIYLYNDAKLTADGCTFKSNSSTENGGAIAVYGATLNVKGNTRFEENQAVGDGGAIGVYNHTYEVKGATEGTKETVTIKSSLDINGATFKKNRAKTGGALYVNKNEYTVSNAQFIENSTTDAEYGGGAIYNTGAISTLSGVTFEGNHSHKGGAVALHTKSEMTVTDMTATGNYAEANSEGKEGNGGVFYVNASALKLNEGAGKTILLGGEGENANYAVSGGAIYAAMGANAPYVEISGAQIKGNISTYANSEYNTTIGGGAIYIRGGELKLSGVSLENNSTGYYGGAVLSLGATVTVNSNSVISGNSGGTGSALYFRDICTVTIEDSTVSNNISISNGVIYNNGGTLTLNRVTATGNSAKNGGVIYASGAATVKVNGGEFSENSATSDGGAIYTDSVTLNLVGGRYYKNSANNGGAVYARLATLDAQGVTFEENSSTNHGGAIFLSGSVMTASGENLFNKNSADNHAGAINVQYYREEGKSDVISQLTMAGGTFEGNSALGGGAVSIRSACEASFDGTTFKSNSVAGYDKNQDGDGEGGGAIYVGYGKLTLTDVTMTSNTAEEGFGGAVDSLGSTVNITDTTIKSGNNGIYAHSGKLNLGGKVIVSENTDSNVFLKEGMTITVVNALDVDAYIGVTASTGVIAKGGTDITVTDYADRFHSDTDAPIYSENGKLMQGFVILTQPSAINGYTVYTSGSGLSYQWYEWIDGAIGEAVEGQTNNSLTGVFVGESYVCQITYNGMTLTTTPVVYYDNVYHAVCGSTCGCGAEVPHDSVEWTPVTNLDELKEAMSQKGSYYLTFDVELESTLTVSAEVQLDLNGHRISAKGDGKFPLINVKADAALTLCDGGSLERSGYIDPETKLWVEGVYEGTEDVTVYTLFGGVITGGKESAIKAGGKLELYNVNLAGNSSDATGGAIYTTSSIYAYNTTFVGNKAGTNGGAINLVGAKMTAKGDNKFTYNTAGGHAGAIYVTYINGGSNGYLDMTGGAFEENSAKSGGAVSIRSDCEAYFDGTTFQNNSITVGDIEGHDGNGEGGGAIYVGYGTLTLTNVTMTGNEATDSFGGAVNACKAVFNVSGGRFEGNTALYGGAFHVIINSTLTVENNAVFTQNVSTFEQVDGSYNSNLGGGAILSNDSTVTLSGVTLQSNSSDYYGGGLLAIGGSVTINSNSIISENNGGTGAALYFKDGCQVLIENSSITNNTSTANGVIYTSGATLTLKGVTATDNTAISGGVIFASSASTVNISGGRYYNNSANNGGAVYVKTAKIDVKGANFEENAAENNGGAIYLDGAEMTASGENSFLNNSAVNHGGAVYVTYVKVTNNDETTTTIPGVLDMTEGTFDGNKALGGGAVSVRSNCEATFNGTIFQNNSVTSGDIEDHDGDGEGGGAIYVGFGKLTLTNVTMTGNNATDGFGGAIDAVDGTVTVTGGSFTNNTAAISGGAIHSIKGTVIEVSGATFSGNVSKYAQTNNQIGGGAILISGGNLTVSGSTFSANETGYYGGAIHAIKSTVTLKENCTVSGSVGKTGSALYFRDGCTTTIENCSITDNKNDNGNGVVYSNGGTLKVSSLTATGNKAYNGGVFYVSGGAVVTLTNVKASGNEAVQNGGVIFTSVKVTLDGCNFGGDILVGEETKSGNTAKLGGAIYVENGTVDVKGTTLTNNTATATGGAIYVIAGTVNVSDDSIISNNTAKNGGAIGLINKATVNVTSSTIQSNTSTSDGGAVWMQGGVLNANAGSIFDGNSAPSGGAICIDRYTETPDGATEAIVVEADVNVNGAEFKNNTATSHGGAIFLVNGSLELIDAKMNGNKATGGHGGAVYTKSNETINVSGTKTLFENNTAKQHGGAFYLTYQSDVLASKLKVTNGTFKNNSAVAGGAISGRTGTSITVTGTTFEGNSASGTANNEGGGAIYANDNIVILSGVTLDGNSSAYYGGAIAATNADLTIKDNSIIKNNKGTTGVALQFRGTGTYTLTDVTVENNNQNASGNVPTSSGVVYLTGTGKLTITNMTATGNKNKNGGVLYISGGTVEVYDSTFSENTATADGGAINIRVNDALTLNNCTITGNKAATGGGIYATAGVTYTKDEATNISGNTATTGADEYTAS